MTGLAECVLSFSMPGGGEWVVILIIGLLIFGRRLPEVARSLGKSVNEFKKGMREFQDSADEVTRDVNKVTNEVASEVKKASGMDDYGYQDPNTDPYGASQSATTGSSSESDAGVTNAVEPTTAPDTTTEGSASPATETPSKPDEQATSMDVESVK